MRTFAKLFGRSPIPRIRVHMERVTACVSRTREIFEALKRGDFEQVERLAMSVSELEHEADHAKHDIQDHLPETMILPTGRTAVLDILMTQDRIADTCENIAVQLTYKRLQIPEALAPVLDRFVERNFEAFDLVRRVIDQWEGLLGTAFGGAQADRLREMVAEVCLKEHEVDMLQRDLLKRLYAHGDDLGVADFYLWSDLIRQISKLSNQSERLANRVRVTLELKR